jgi:hypothetical protein
MKVFSVFLIMMSITVSYGQEKKFVIGAATNLAKYPLNTFGLDAIFMKTNTRFQGVLNVDYMNGKYNYNKDRYKIPINENVVTHVEDRSKGWGLGAQINVSLLNEDEDRIYDLLIGFGYQYQSIKMRFKEDMYVSDPPFFFYREQFFNEPIITHRGQVMCLFQVQKPIFAEIGIGIAQRNAKASETLNAYRDYNKYFIDNAYSGLMPVMSFKVGYLINR